MSSRPATTCDALPDGAEAEEPRAFVACLGPTNAGTVPLPQGQTVSAGRSHSCELQLDDPAASRLHFTLRWEGGDDVVLVDRESRNGTFVDRERIRGEVRVGTGSEIRVGDSRFLVVVRPSDDVSTSPTTPIDDEDLIAHSPRMLAAVAMADRAAAVDVTVLLVGETGVGKEVIARRIHRKSARAKRPFVAVNCAAIPDSLAESMLFGHERGSFTGALKQQKGVFEESSGGTLFLDEVGELQPANQARLLRVLEERSVVRLGSNQPVRVDVRLVAATHRDLVARVAEGAFRQDLRFRLDVVRIEIPPLRDRPEDVIPIAERVLRQLSPGRPKKLSTMARRALLAYEWPGNVRELRNKLEAAVATGTGDVIQEEDLRSIAPIARSGTSPLKGRVEETERDAIVEALHACGGNQTRVAERLGVSRRTLVYRLEKYALQDVAYEARKRKPRDPAG